MRCGIACCGIDCRCPQKSAILPQRVPLCFPSAAPQAFLILWSNSVIWLNVSGCSAICLVIFCTA